MFGAPTKVLGARRAFPVKDRVVSHRILDNVQTAAPRTRVFHAKWGDLARIDASASAIAVNPAGRQVFLVLTTLGDRSAVFLVHAPSRTVELVPMRFARARHAAGTVAKCTQCTRERLLIVNDVCGAEHASVHARLRAVHDLVHDDHTPDAALFPLRVVARRCFSFAQISEVRRFMACDDVRAHSLSIIGPSAAPETRIPTNLGPSAGRRTDVARRAAPRVAAPVAGMFADAPIVAAPGADAYRIQLPGAAPDAWGFLAVKTIEESAALAGLNLQTPLTCRVVWDGAAWRIAMFEAPGARAPAHGPRASDHE